MHIAFNARILQSPRTGIGHYLCELVTAFKQLENINTHLFDGLHWNTELPPPNSTPRQARIKQWIPFAYTLRRHVEQRFFNQGLQKLPIDLYHEPSLWPLDFDGLTVMTVHDLTHLEYPETQPANRLREINKRLPASLQHVAHILVDSHFIAQELVRCYSVAPSSITVAPLGVSARFHPRTINSLTPLLKPMGVEPGRYILCVGTLEPRKNITLALRAHALLPHDLRSRFPLIIVGMSGWKMHALHHELDLAINRGHIRMLGYQTDAHVAALTAGARALAFPSRYEGFGLPILEAMASGTPVILTAQAAMPEVAGEAGIYAQQDDIDGWASTLQHVIEDNAYHNEKSTLGLARASLFTWQRCAAITANVYQQVLTR